MLAKSSGQNQTLKKEPKDAKHESRLGAKNDDYKELAKKLQTMINSLGYKSSAYIIDSRKMFN